MRKPAACWIVGVVLCASLVAATETPYVDPWDVATETAAEAAVARLGGQHALAVSGEVLDVPGLDVATGGGAIGIVASVQELRQALRDLGASETDLEVTVDLPADVLFDFDKSEIRTDAATALARLATVIRGYPGGAVLVEGHTDAAGNDDYNEKLSQRRAESVKAWLVDREAIGAESMTTAGKGEREPVASNDDDAGRQKNRRVRAVIRKSQ